MRCWEIKEKLFEYLPSSLFACEDNNEFLTIHTPFSYPDGDDIDLFILTSNSQIVVSDMGETLRFLSTHDLEIKNSKIRSEILEDVLSTLGVSYFKSHLYITIKTLDEIGEAILRMAQAVTRICDLLYTIKGRSIANFREEVRDLLESANLEYEEDYQARGGSTLIYNIDFGIKARNTIRLVKLVTTTSPAGSRSTVDRISRLWLDVAQVTTDKSARISLIDDTNLIWRPEEINVLSYISTIHIWSRKEIFIEDLKVA